MAISTITVHAALAPDETFTAPTQAAVGEIYWFHMLPDGKILAGGEKLFRLNADGTLDPTYPVISYPGGFMRQPALEPDGGIVVHGVYYDPTGERSFDGLIRYHADGTEDETFRPVFGGYDQVHHLARDSAGRYIIGGTFPSHGDAALIRLNHDGSFDIGFDLGEFAVNGLATLPNGQTLVAGALLENRYFKESALVRLSSTGRVLQMTHPGTMGTLTVDRQGRILFSGQFASVLGRLTPRGVADKHSTRSLAKALQIRVRTPLCLCLTVALSPVATLANT